MVVIKPLVLLEKQLHVIFLVTLCELLLMLDQPCGIHFHRS